MFAVVAEGFESARKLSMTMVLEPCMLSLKLKSRCRYRPLPVVDLLPVFIGSKSIRPALARATFFDETAYR